MLRIYKKTGRIEKLTDEPRLVRFNQLVKSVSCRRMPPKAAISTSEAATVESYSIRVNHI